MRLWRIICIGAGMPRIAYDDAHIIILTGKDKARFLDGLSSNKIDFQDNQVISTCILSNKAKILGQLHLFNLNEMLVGITITDDFVKLVDYLNMKILGQDVGINDVTKLNYVDLIFDEEISNVEISSKDGCTIVTIEGKYQFEMYSTKLERKPCNTNLEAFNEWRIKHIIPWYGFEISSKKNPYQCGLNSQVHENKGCFTGQEILTRMRTRGKGIYRWTCMENESLKPDEASTHGKAKSLVLKRGQ